MQRPIWALGRLLPVAALSLLPTAFALGCRGAPTDAELAARKLYRLEAAEAAAGSLAPATDESPAYDDEEDDDAEPVAQTRLGAAGGGAARETNSVDRR